mmetsp:Transcript_13141/g.41658  ORF Transcript_13141/g.41658 Transcript_13141/m.41658 type:complete len:208 (+) Transcript_13141:344-967(+)
MAGCCHPEKGRGRAVPSPRPSRTRSLAGCSASTGGCCTAARRSWPGRRRWAGLASPSPPSRLTRPPPGPAGTALARRTPHAARQRLGGPPPARPAHRAERGAPPPAALRAGALRPGARPGRHHASEPPRRPSGEARRPQLGRAARGAGDGRARQAPLRAAEAEHCRRGTRRRHVEGRGSEVGGCTAMKDKLLLSSAICESSHGRTWE